MRVFKWHHRAQCQRKTFFQRFAPTRYMTTLRSCSMIVFLFPCCAKIWNKAIGSVMNFSDASWRHSKANGWNLYCSVNSISLTKSATISFTSLANPFFGICSSFRKCSASRSRMLCRCGTGARHDPAGCTFWAALIQLFVLQFYPSS